MGEGSQPCPFAVTGNGQGGVTEPKSDHLSSRNLFVLPNFLDFLLVGTVFCCFCASKLIIGFAYDNGLLLTPRYVLFRMHNVFWKTKASLKALGINWWLKL